MALVWRRDDSPDRFPAALRLSLLEERLARGDAHAGLRRSIARVRLELDRPQDAWTALTPVLDHDLDAETRLLAGVICRRIGRFDEALRYLRAVPPGGPDHVAVIIEQARCHDGLGQWDQARVVLEHGLRVCPRHPDVWVEFATMAMAHRDDMALRRLFAATEPPTAPVACLTAARVFLAEVEGDRQALDHWLDPGLVRVCDVCRPGDPLLDQVLCEVMALDNFVQDPEGKTTDGGWQAGLTSQSSRPGWHALRDRIHASVERYVDDLASAGHPMASAPASVRLTAWVVRLHAGGFQHPHIHATAWISGVCYLAVPRPASGDVENAGALLLPRTMIAPEPGRLVLFPSYMRHSTVPFGGDGERVCIAFDVKPAAPTRDSESGPTLSG